MPNDDQKGQTWKKNKLLVEEPIAAWKLSCENDTVIEKLNIQGNRCLKRVTYHNLKEYNKCQVLWRSMCAAVAGRRPARGVRCVPAVINGGLRRPQARVDCLFDLRVISDPGWGALEVNVSQPLLAGEKEDSRDAYGESHTRDQVKLIGWRSPT